MILHKFEFTILIIYIYTGNVLLSVKGKKRTLETMYMHVYVSLHLVSLKVFNLFGTTSNVFSSRAVESVFLSAKWFACCRI